MSARRSAHHAFLEQHGVPAGWDAVRLRDLVHIVGGGTPDSAEPSYWNGAIPWLTPTEMTTFKGRFATTSERRLTEAGVENSNCRLLPVGSLVLSTRGTIGSVAIAGVPLTCNQSCEALLPKDGTDSEYLYYLLTYIRPLIERFGAGTTFSSVTRRDIRDIRVAIPSPDSGEQRLIADILVLADDAIAIAGAKLTAARRLKTALMQQLFTRGIPRWHSRFKQTKIGEIPESWDLSQLRQLFRSSTNGLYVPDADYGSGTPIVRIDTFEDGDFYSRDFDRVRISDREVDLFEIKVGDVLFNRVNSIPFVGKVVFVDGLVERTVFESNMMRLRFDDADLAHYVSLALCEPSTKRRIWSMARPAIGQLSINQRELGQFFIPLPQENERKEIVTLISTAKKNITACEAELRAIEKLKRSLMQNLLTGRVRVRLECHATAD